MPNTAPPVVTRFAPGPTGDLHLGHAYSALFAASKGDRFLVRIEDIDTLRVKAEFEDAIFDDLAWLGLEWETPVRRQSEHFDEYQKALDTLQSKSLLYPCFCSRKEIRAEIDRSGGAPHGVEGPLYPGTCRNLSDNERAQRRDAGNAFALRLDAGAALQSTGALAWNDAVLGTIDVTMEGMGDVVLARKESPASYHLAVTIDDHAQGVTLVTRGDDLFPSTHVHRLLQALLGLNTPAYHHHRMLTGEDGKRLAKRDQSQTLRALREAGKSAAEVQAMAGF
ncbi:MAG: tRNA glutamyl-Q(34) synthetase GluQRS [Rhodospirillales bacterium]